MKTLIRVAVVAACVATASPALAQSASVPPRVLFDVGGTIIGGGALGSVDATYLTPTGSTLTLFSTAQSWTAGAGLVAHLAMRVKPRVQLELTESWTRPQAKSAITGDFESAVDTVATQRVSQFVTGGGLVVSFAPHGKWTPFARGSVSWLRHLSNDLTLYQDGISTDIGGGVRYAWTEKSGHIKPYGVRADIWLNVRSGGIELSQKSRIFAPGFSASFIFKL